MKEKLRVKCLKAKHGLIRKGKFPILLALARATVLRGESILGDFSLFAWEI